ncbi:GNAT family N-acetyltransferase [Enterococcus casseliflavus]|uniref:GNAT family N-acetyltransferase n=1 Tax=Enterococcus TaxID=1350 RepID=UPI0012DEA555|nr:MULTISPECIES: GNAT family N-acetyltransferase [Enterococcus]MBF0011197.1 GNAT family N-acetyltransferase [Enterococcus casseliflavus]QGR83075.1 GNAT family N-acetyltransferase [Enterococcus gallinarum]
MKDDIEYMEGLARFSGENDVDSFLFYDALDLINQDRLITTGVFKRETSKLVAFYTLTVESHIYNFEEDDTLSLAEKEQLRSFSLEDLQRSVLSLKFLGVKEDERGKGIGTYIIDKIFRIARRVSTKQVFVEALLSAKEFYEKRNFEIVSSEDELINATSVLMVRIISPFETALISNSMDDCLKISS